MHELAHTPDPGEDHPKWYVDITTAAQKRTEGLGYGPVSNFDPRPESSEPVVAEGDSQLEPAQIDGNSEKPERVRDFDKKHQVSQPTPEWHEPFQKKVEEAIRFIDSHDIDIQSYDKIRKLLIEQELLEVGITDATVLSKQDIVTALLLTHKGAGRFLKAKKTADTAKHIIQTGQIPQVVELKSKISY